MRGYVHPYIYMCIYIVKYYITLQQTSPYIYTDKVIHRYVVVYSYVYFSILRLAKMIAIASLFSTSFLTTQPIFAKRTKRDLEQLQRLHLSTYCLFALIQFMNGVILAYGQWCFDKLQPLSDRHTTLELILPALQITYEKDDEEYPEDIHDDIEAQIEFESLNADQRIFYQSTAPTPFLQILHTKPRHSYVLLGNKPKGMGSMAENGPHKKMEVSFFRFERVFMSIQI